MMAPVFWCLFLSFPPFVVVTSVVLGLLARMRNQRRLDEALAGFGPGRAYLISGRAWSFEREGRRFEAMWLRQTFTLSVKAPVAHALQFGRDNTLARAAGGALGRTPVELGDGVIAYGRDDGALQDLLARDGVMEAARTLCAQDGRSLRSVALLEAGRIQLSARYLTATAMAGEHEAWLKALARLADAVEG